MDTKSLDGLANALRTQTESRSVSPSTISNIFDKVSELIADAVSTNQLNALAIRIAEVANSSDTADKEIKSLISETTAKIAALQSSDSSLQSKYTSALALMNEVKSIVSDETTRAESAESNLETRIDNLSQDVESNAKKITSAQRYRIAIQIIDGELYLRGEFAKLKNNNCCAVLLRRIKKRNGKMCEERRVHGSTKKGWLRYGNQFSIKILESGKVQFINADHKSLASIDNYSAGTYTTDCSCLMKVTSKGICWGMSKAELYRTHHFPFAIVFTSDTTVKKSSPLDMLKIVSNMATFHVTYCEAEGDWKFKLSA